MDRPIFILGCTKSGTTLMRNLFDGLPEFYVIPTESHFFQNIGYWVSYKIRRMDPKKYSFQEMKQNLLGWIEHMNSFTQTVTDGFTEKNKDC